MSQSLGTAALLDSMGRFVSNVGVPAAIAFFVLNQIGPKLDVVALEQRQTNTQLAVLSVTCTTPRTNTIPGSDVSP